MRNRPPCANLITDFFNRIGPSRKYRTTRKISAFRGGPDIGGSTQYHLLHLAWALSDVPGDGFERNACLAHSSSPLRSTTHASHAYYLIALAAIADIFRASGLVSDRCESLSAAVVQVCWPFWVAVSGLENYFPKWESDGLQRLVRARGRLVRDETVGPVLGGSGHGIVARAGPIRRS